MEKKNINWEVPKPLAVSWDQMITEKFGAKGKWLGAAAAMMMYMEASPEQIDKYDRMATDLRVPGRADAVIATVTGENPPPLRVAAKKATPQKSTRARPGSPKRSKPGEG